jgi:hypothetical protein
MQSLEDFVGPLPIGLDSLSAYSSEEVDEPKFGPLYTL